MMKFEDIQAIWDSHPDPNGVLDQRELQEKLKQRDRSFHRIVSLIDYLMMITLLILALMFFRDPVLERHDLVLILPGLACLLAVGMLWSWRRNRKRRELAYDDDLRGLISKSIDGIDDRIAWWHRFTWWFFLPNILGLLIALFIVEDSKRYLFYAFFLPAFFLCMGFAYWHIRIEIRHKLLPEKNRLLALQNQLERED
ncbi:hypothetical protein SH139x_002573 [Planctomycetaceae bacterium SH139]